MSQTLYFLPWLRGGLAGLQQETGVPLRFGVSLQGQRRDGGAPDIHSFADRDVRLLGPGAVIGLQLDDVLRQDPKPGATLVEPNYFAAVEFRSADLPWRYTPAAPDADGHLQPWLALVVVEDRPGVTLSSGVGQRLRTLTVDDAATELPPLKDAWSWAHVQYEGDLPEDPDDQNQALRSAHEATDPALRARLICPRRMDPGRTYIACVVPIYEAGRLAGLGTPGSQDFGPAWQDASASVTLPVYLSWRFSTGQRGDFEALVSRLSPSESDSSIGLRQLDLRPLEVELDVEPGDAYFAGALVSPAAMEQLAEIDQNPDDDRRDFQSALAKRVNSAQSGIEGKEPPAADPVVAPPAYGRSYVGNAPVHEDGEAKGWFTQLNTQVRHRAAAGLGAELVRAHQETLMDQAWDAVGNVRRANALLNVAQMARGVGKKSTARLAKLGTAARLRVMAPAFNAISARGGPATINAQLHRSALPNGLFAGSARRITRPMTGLTSEGGNADPGGTVVSAFLSNPTGELGAYRDDLEPIGLTADATPAPTYIEPQPGTGLGQVVLSRPKVDARNRVAFSVEDGTDGLIEAVDATLDADALVSRSVTARIPALKTDTAAMPPRIEMKPLFPEPLYQKLRDASAEMLVPGLGQIPSDTVTILVPNPAFVRAFMVGFNHEMGREFLWREYPTPLHTTWFQNFWSLRQADIDPIAKWRRDEALSGAQPKALNGNEIVMVIRGALPQRYPDLRLYAVPAQWLSIKDANGVTHWYRREAETGQPVWPHIAGKLSDDVFFFGFRLSVAQASGGQDQTGSAGYFFAFEQLPGAPRFGLESAHDGAQFGAAPDNWQTVSWNDVTPEGAEDVTRFLDLEATAWMVDGIERPGNGPDVAAWAADAAIVARQTLQRPARVLMHASAMLPD